VLSLYDRSLTTECVYAVFVCASACPELAEWVAKNLSAKNIKLCKTNPISKMPKMF